MAVTINIEKLFISPESTYSVLGELDQAAAPEALRDTDYPDVSTAAATAQPEAPNAEAEQDRAEAITVQHAQTDIDTTARYNFLRNVVYHADQARRLEGFQTNHQRRPRKLSVVNAKQNSEQVKAEESLRRACAVCALRKSCRIAGNIDAWLDVHPYKSGPKGQLRPGSLPVETESRTTLLRALKQDPLAHCEPAKRK